MKSYTSTFIFIFILLLGITSCRNKPETPEHVAISNLDTNDQIVVGEEINSFIQSNPSKFDVLSSEEYSLAYEYLNSFLLTLIRTAEVERRSAFDWKVIILKDDSQTSAFTLPGGYIYLYTGLLKFLKNESELISVLAHEIYYADSDLAANAIFEVMDGNMLSDLSLRKDVGDISQELFNFRDLLFDELDIIKADNFSIDVICPFQYDANGLYSLMLEAGGSGSSSIDWFQVRPITTIRMNNLIERAAICGVDEATFNERYMEFLASLP